MVPSIVNRADLSQDLLEIFKMFLFLFCWLIVGQTYAKDLRKNVEMISIGIHIIKH